VSGRAHLGLTSATALVVANMVGVGVFTTSGFALADLGSPGRVLAAWAVGGLFALLGALSYGALAARMAESGGEYLFLSRTIHPLAGFLAGWVSLLAGFTAPIAAAAAGLDAYLGPLVLPGARAPWIGSAAIALVAVLHGLRAAPGVLAQNAVVALKLALLAVFVAIAAPRLDLAPLQAPPPAFAPGAFAVALVWISFSYSGWNAAVYVAGEVRDGARNVPRALLLGTLLTAALYLVVNAVFVFAAPSERLAGREDIAAAAAQALGGDALAALVRAIVAIALFTSISAMVMAGPRVYARMADDGLFPRLLATRGEVPAAAIALQAALALAVLWSAGLAELLGYIGYTLGLSAAATVCGLFVLRRREGVAAFGHPLVPAAFVVGTLAVSAFMVARRPAEALWGIATIALGVVAYVGLRPASRPTSGTPR
jgi:APA family basic amino acid/polyamine antiporter